MGRKSIKENKTQYQLAREAMDLTREAASDKMGYISADRIEKIESEKTQPYPEDILAMSKAYNSPELCNYYCSNKCPIGQKYVPEIQVKSLSQITLEMVASLNALEKEKNRLIEITVDGVISEDEIADFNDIRGQLNQISMTIDALSLWVEKTIADGKLS